MLGLRLRDQMQPIVAHVFYAEVIRRAAVKGTESCDGRNVDRLCGQRGPASTAKAANRPLRPKWARK